MGRSKLLTQRAEEWRLGHLYCAAWSWWAKLVRAAWLAGYEARKRDEKREKH